MTGRGALVIGRPGALARGIADRVECVALAMPADSESGTDELFEGISGIDTVIFVTSTRPFTPIHALSVECWREIAIDPLRQVFWVVRRAVEGFLADAVDGRVVLVVDESNDVVVAALRSLTRSFAREYGRRGLACNLVVCSGSDCSDSGSAVVEQVVFLASPAASFVNGEALFVTCPAR